MIPPTRMVSPDGWANNRTWIYTGQIHVTTNFMSLIMNNDDTDWLKINGVIVLDDNTWNDPIQALSGAPVIISIRRPPAAIRISSPAWV